MDEPCYYHATSETNWLAIQRTGAIEAGNYFAELDIAEYYLETVEDEGEDAVLLAIPVSAFSVDRMQLDSPGLAEPVCFSTRGMSEDTVHEAWAQTDGSVAACIDLIGSFQYDEAIPVTRITVVS